MKNAGLLWPRKIIWLGPGVSAKICRPLIFWLVFKQGNEVAVIIQPAGEIITARMRAMLSGIEGEFQEGHRLETKMAKKVPKALIGKILSRTQAAALLKKLDK